MRSLVLGFPPCLPGAVRPSREEDGVSRSRQAAAVPGVLVCSVSLCPVTL